VARAIRARAGCHSRNRLAAEWRNHSRSEDFRTIHIRPAVSAVASDRRPDRGFLLQCNTDGGRTPSGHAPPVLECHFTLIGTAR
jgi:hypothetical protein